MLGVKHINIYIYSSYRSQTLSNTSLLQLATMSNSEGTICDKLNSDHTLILRNKINLIRQPRITC